MHVQQPPTSSWHGAWLYGEGEHGSNGTLHVFKENLNASVVLLCYMDVVAPVRTYFANT